jgi:hypothetical protein
VHDGMHVPVRVCARTHARPHACARSQPHATLSVHTMSMHTLSVHTMSTAHALLMMHMHVVRVHVVCCTRTPRATCTHGMHIRTGPHGRAPHTHRCVAVKAPSVPRATSGCSTLTSAHIHSMAASSAPGALLVHMTRTPACTERLACLARPFLACLTCLTRVPLMALVRMTRTRCTSRIVCVPVDASSTIASNDSHASHSPHASRACYCDDSKARMLSHALYTCLARLPSRLTRPDGPSPRYAGPGPGATPPDGSPARPRGILDLATADARLADFAQWARFCSCLHP